MAASDVVLVAELDFAPGQVQPSLVGHEVAHAALEAPLPGPAADEELAVGGEGRGLGGTAHRRPLVDLQDRGAPAPLRLDVVEEAVVDSFLECLEARLWS